MFDDETFPPITDADMKAAEAVAAEMRGHGSLPPLTDEQRLQRQIENELWLAERRWRDEQQRAASERARLEAAAQRQRDEAIADAEARQKASREFMERSRERDHQPTVYEKLVATERFRNEAVAAARRQAAQQNHRALLDDIQRDINNLKPAPEPTAVVIVEPDEDIGVCGIKPVRWR